MFIPRILALLPLLLLIGLAPPAIQDVSPQADVLAGLRQSLAGHASLGIAADKKALDEEWVSEAVRAAVRRDGRATKLNWKPAYEHLGRWGTSTRDQAASEGVHCVLVVQSLTIKKGGKITTNFKPIGAGNSRPIKFRGAKVTMKFRVDVFDPFKKRWNSVGRWSVEEDRTQVPAVLSGSDVKNGIATLDPGELIAGMLESEMRAHAHTALRASVQLPEERSKDWVFSLTPNEERELWRRLTAMRFGRWSYRLSDRTLLPAREFGELALARLEEPEQSARSAGLRARAAKFLRPLLVHFRDGAGAGWPRALSIPTTEHAPGFRALFDAGLASLDRPKGIRFDPAKEGEKQSKGSQPFDLLIHESLMEDGLISTLPFAGVMRSYLVVVSDEDKAAAPEEWAKALKGLTGAAIVERVRGKLVRSAVLAPGAVTSESLAELLLERVGR